MIPVIAPMSTVISNSATQIAAGPRPRRDFLGTALFVAALANAFVPAVLFSQTSFFGQAEPRFRALVAAVVLVQYAIAFLLLLLHANVGFASGYAFATAAVVAAGSATLAFLTVFPARWSWNALSGEMFVLTGFAFAVLANVVFLAAAIRYARAIHPRLHLGGFVRGIAASLAVVYLYVRVFP
jgi:hypothetical protein